MDDARIKYVVDLIADPQKGRKTFYNASLEELLSFLDDNEGEFCGWRTMQGEELMGEAVISIHPKIVAILEEQSFIERIPVPGIVRAVTPLHQYPTKQSSPLNERRSGLPEITI